MSKMKKTVAIFMAVIMALSLAMPALAADPPAQKGTVTISNAVANEQYQLYRVLNVTYDGNTNYSYSVNDNFKNFFSNYDGFAGKNEVASKVNSGSTFDIAVYTYITGLDKENVRKLADQLAAYVENDSTISPTRTVTGAASGQTTVSDVDFGYYLMIPTTGTGNNRDGIIVFSLETLANELVITNKVTYPTPTKKVQGPNDGTSWNDVTFAGIGDTVKFQVTGRVERIDAFDTFQFEMHDKLTNMSYVDKSVKLYIDYDGSSTTPAVEYNNNGELIFNNSDGSTKVVTDDALTVSYNNASKTLDIVIKDLKPYYKTTMPVIGRLEYSATVDETANIGITPDENGVIGNPNEIYFRYSNDPITSSEFANSVTSKTNTYVLQLTLNKKDNSATPQPLSGSKWKLEKLVGGQWIEVDNINTENISSFVFKGIGIGNYRLRETKAPEGYVPIHNPITFSVSAEGTMTQITQLACKVDDHSNVIGRKATIDRTGTTTEDEGAIVGTFSIDVKNTSQTLLPETGGAGLYIVAGVAIVALLGFGGTAMLKRKVNGGE